jgi:hypothetical protein
MCALNIICSVRQNKDGNMGGVRYLGLGHMREMRSAYVLLEKMNWRRSLTRPWHRWDVNIKLCLMELRYERVT